MPRTGIVRNRVAVNSVGCKEVDVEIIGTSSGWSGRREGVRFFVPLRMLVLLKSRLNEALSLQEPRLRASWHAKIREAPAKESLAALWLGNFGVSILTTTVPT